MSPELKGILIAGLALSAIFVLVFATMSVGGPVDPRACVSPSAGASGPVAQTEIPAQVLTQAPGPSLAELAEAEAQNRPVKVPRVAARKVLVAQANLYGRMSADRFKHDLQTVVSGGPDIVTLNETYFRSQAELEPEGYAAWRTEAPFDARETPVLWRTDRWKLRDGGKLLMHSQPGKWGTRYVNWVTLDATKGGQMVSVISVHTSPGGRGRGSLLGQYLSRLDDLVTALRTRGPVIIGGDFNANYLASGPRNVLTSAFEAMKAQATVAELGEPAGGYRTDHGGGALDYVVLAGAKALGQSVSPLTYSDHKMVRALVELPAKKLPVRAVPKTKKKAAGAAGAPATSTTVPSAGATTVPMAEPATTGCAPTAS